MFDEIKTLLVERTIECPMCNEILNNGDIMYKDEYRGETICQHCIEEYKKDVIREEGIDGRLLK
jgi:transcription elongation factor Elf1